MKTIEITVTPSGESKVETKGFSGSDCLEASQFLEDALGERTSERMTAEFYQQSEQRQQAQEGT